ncbi:MULTISPECIES: hypothetical protein [Aliarcobacter]|uniref:hypothetical protein n=1 Tax=Aliarcobacter TaxID=2321111 RepID=UPI0021B1A8D4|nr:MULTISPECIES: hypothetical protein [Aliarcobacter]MCT7544429.1 hypothetical protein [Aliarcobacter cryaerophilus]MCT7578506.1 hypothetical protein [Aliarcobacter butzleri]
MKKHILFLPLTLLFFGCANKEKNISTADVIGCRSMGLNQHPIALITTIPFGYMVQKTGEMFKDEEETRSQKQICDEVIYGKYVDEAIAKEKAQKEKLENEDLAQEQENVKGVSDE